MFFYLGVLELLLACTLHHAAYAQDDFGGGDEAGGGEDMVDMESMGIGSDTGNSMGGKVTFKSAIFLNITFNNSFKFHSATSLAQITNFLGPDLAKP